MFDPTETPDILMSTHIDSSWNMLGGWDHKLKDLVLGTPNGKIHGNLEYFEFLGNCLMECD